jgi:hypothetical protein
MSWIIDRAGLHITIGASVQTKEIDGQEYPTLKGDVQMVKAALLYADQVKLCSLGASMALLLKSMASYPNKKKLQFLMDMPSLVPDELGDLEPVWREYKRLRKTLDRNERARLDNRMEQRARDLWPTVEQMFRDRLGEIDFDDLLDALDSGLLQTHSFDLKLTQFFQKGIDRALVLEYATVVGKTLEDRMVYPLFDKDTGEMISAGLAQGLFPLSDEATRRGKEVGLAADLFAKLPLFEDASVKEILDIRRELERPLVRFRSAMIEYSESINNAQWDQDFPSDAERVFREKVAPAILDLEEQVRENKYLRELIKSATNPATWLVTVASQLALRMSNLHLSELANLSILALIQGVNAFYGWKGKALELSQNKLFFCYKAGTFLSERRFEYVRKD